MDLEEKIIMKGDHRTDDNNEPTECKDFTKRTHTVSIYPKAIKDRPEKIMSESDQKKFWNNITKNSSSEAVTLDQLEEKILAGHVITYCELSGGRKDDNFVSTSLIALDFDNDAVVKPLLEQRLIEENNKLKRKLTQLEKINLKQEVIRHVYNGKYKWITPKDVLNILKDKGLNCCLIYTSLSNCTDDPMNAIRFRVIIQLEELIMGVEEGKEMKTMFQSILPEVDAVGLTQSFFGGKEIAYRSDEVVNREDFMITMEVYRSNLETTQMGKRAIQKRLKPFHGKNAREVWRKSSQNTTHANNIYKEVWENANNYSKNRWSNRITRRSLSDLISNACNLSNTFRDFYNKNKWIHHSDLKWLASIFISYKDGVAKFKELILDNPNISNEKIGIINHFEKLRKKQGYFPEMDIPVHDLAYKKIDKLGDVGAFHTKSQAIPLQLPNLIIIQEAQIQLEAFFDECAKHSQGKFFLKAETGLGKSYQLARQDLIGCVVAFDRHDNIRQFASELDKLGKDYTITPDPKDYLDKDTLEVYKNICSLGLISKANKYLKDQQVSHPKVAEFLRLKASLRKSEKTLLVTHQQLLYIDFPKHHTYYIDEDICSQMLYLGAITSDVCETILDKMRAEGCNAEDIDLIDRLHNHILLRGKVLPSVDKLESTQLRLNKPEDFAKVVYEVKDQLGGSHDIMTLMSGDCHSIVDPVDFNDPNGPHLLRYIKKRKLPDNKKIVMVSATMSQFMIDALFGNQFIIEEIPLTELQGHCVQISDLGVSASALKRGKGDKYMLNLKLASVLSGDRAVITFNAFKDYFVNPIQDLNIYASTGSNNYQGKDIVVVGDPHLPTSVYRLMSKALGYEWQTKDLELEFLKVQSDGFDFMYYTFRHEGLRKIQFYCIDRIIQQAVGRARANRTDGNVLAICRKPIPRFTQCKVSRRISREDKKLLEQMGFDEIKQMLSTASTN